VGWRRDRTVAHWALERGHSCPRGTALVSPAPTGHLLGTICERAVRTRADGRKHRPKRAPSRPPVGRLLFVPSASVAHHGRFHGGGELRRASGRTRAECCFRRRRSSDCWRARSTGQLVRRPERACATRRHMTGWGVRGPTPGRRNGREKLGGSRPPEVGRRAGAAPDDVATVHRRRAGCASKAERRRETDTSG
jgi:hypothetical protein